MRWLLWFPRVAGVVTRSLATLAILAFSVACVPRVKTVASIELEPALSLEVRLQKAEANVATEAIRSLRQEVERRLDGQASRDLARKIGATSRVVGLTRLRGHLTRGGYDVQDDERDGVEAGA